MNPRPTDPARLQHGEDESLAYRTETPPVGRGFNPGIVMSETDGVLTPEVSFSQSAMETYAITTTAYQRRALFVRTANAELLVKTLFHYRDQGRYLLHGFVVMPEHLHVLLTPSSTQTTERCAQCIKGGFSHEVRKQFAGEVWQPGFHEHRIRDGEDFRRQLGYIAANPGKRGLLDYPFVHTRFLDRIDSMSARFVLERKSIPQGLKPLS